MKSLKTVSPEGNSRINFLSTLTFKVLLLIVMVVLPVNTFLIISTVRTADGLYEQVELSMQNIMDLYINTLDIQMQNTDYYLYSLCINDSNFNELCNSTDELRYGNARYRFVQEIQNELSANSVCDAYFFYLEQRDTYVIGNASGIRAEPFEDFLEENLTVSRKWQICSLEEKTYLVRMTKLSDVYYGAFIDLDDVKQEVENSLNYDSGTVFFGSEYPAKNEDQSMVTSESEKAEMYLSAAVNRREINQSLSWWEQRQIVIAVLLLGLLPILYVAIHHWMIFPLRKLNRAHHELEIGNESFS